MMDDCDKIIEPELSFDKNAAKQIYLHRDEFESYHLNNKKINAVKALKEYTGGGLKECLDTINLYFLGLLKSYIIEERKNKLKQLDKPILIDDIILNIKNIENEKLADMFSTIPYDIIESIHVVIQKYKNK